MRASLKLLIGFAALVAGCAAPSPYDDGPATGGGYSAVCSYTPYLSAAESRWNQPRPLAYWERDALAAAAETVSHTVVEVRAVSNPGNVVESRRTELLTTSDRARGSGVLIGPGLVVTSEHVVRGAEVITVLLHGGSARVVHRTETHAMLDVAVLRFDEGNPLDEGARSVLDWDQAGSSVRSAEEAVSWGTAVAAIRGCGDRFFGNLRFGVVTARSVSLQGQVEAKAPRRYDDLVETTVPLEPGYSGGPLIDERGRLVGLCVAVAGDVKNEDCRGYAIPFNAETRRAIAELAHRAAEPAVATGQSTSP